MEFIKESGKNVQNTVRSESRCALRLWNVDIKYRLTQPCFTNKNIILVHMSQPHRAISRSG
jgi:hypothetical protein